MRVSSLARSALLLIFIFHGAYAGLNAQAVWTDKFTARGVTIDHLRGFFEDESISGQSWISYLSGRFPVSATLRLKPEIPFGYETVGENSVVLGNPYLGLEVLGNDGSSTAEIGLRLPAIYSATPMTQVAEALDFDRFEAFSPETAAVTGSFVGRNKSEAVQIEVAGGVTVLVPFNDNDTEILGQYALQIVLQSRYVGAISGMTGRVLFTEGGLSFGQRTTHQFGLTILGLFGDFRPGVMTRIPLDQPLRSKINAVLGFSFSYEIR
jgi:hypothetical protein